jgi:hypothetical protein
MLIGIPPGKSPDGHPEILVAYPPVTVDGLESSKVIELAMPTGGQRKYLRSMGKNPIQDHFVFTMNKTDYGVCVHVEVKAPCFFAPNPTRKSFFAFCFLTQQFVFSAHFLFLAYLILSSLNLTAVCTFTPSRRSFDFAKKSFDFLLVDNDVAHNAWITVPDCFSDALKFFETCSAVSPPLFLGPDLEIYFPSTTNPDAVLYYVLDTLFSLLSVEDIVRLVSAIVRDAQVLVIGDSLKEVTHVVLALQALIKPFTFCGPVIPILPAVPTFLSLLASPTPFLIGVAPTPELRNIAFLDSSIFVHLDRHVISSPLGPSYPHFHSVVDQVDRILAKEKSHAPHPFGYPLIFRREWKHKFCFSASTTDLIDAAIREPLSQIFTDFVYCFFVTDMSAGEDGSGVTVFNSELFLAQCPTEDRPFFTQLLESQNFEMYIERRITEYLANGGADGTIAALARTAAAPRPSETP